MYVRTTTPLTLPAGSIVDGVCLEEDAEVEVDSCSPLHCLMNPQPVPCADDIPVATTEETIKLCELLAVAESIADCLAIIKDQPVAAFANDGFPSGKCTPSNQPIFICKHTDNETNEITWESFAYIDGAVAPYEGECVECNKQYNIINQYVADGIYCDLPVYECEGDLFVFDITTCTFEEIDKLATTFTPYVPGDAPLVCADAQCSLQEVVPADSGTVEDIVAAIIADKGLVFELDGKAPIPVTVDDVMTFSIVRKACNTVTSTGDVVESDWINVNGSQLVNYTDDEEGGVDLAAAIEVPATGCALATVCFEKCFTKAELALLA